MSYIVFRYIAKNTGDARQTCSIDHSMCKILEIKQIQTYKQQIPFVQYIY